MNKDELTIEELRDYCSQLCREGKGGDKVQIAGVGVGSDLSADPYNDKLEWWDGTHIGYDDALRILASDVCYEKTISKKAVKDMVRDIDIALYDLRQGDIGSLEANIGTVQDKIDALFVEVS
jgi:predicted heme/steroid binding protein